MTVKSLNFAEEVSTSGIYKDGIYFKLTDDGRKVIDKKSEDIFSATRFLFLSSNKLHIQSKQEVKNDLIKRDDKYSRTITSALNFLQYHGLRNNNTLTRTRNPNFNRIETALTQDGTKNPNDEDTPPRNISKKCRQFEEGDCHFKTEHIWKKCVNNSWGINNGKSCESNEAMVMCIVGDFDVALDLVPVDAMVYITHTDANLNKPVVMFYNASYSKSFNNISLKR